MIRRPPRSTLDRSSAASDVYKRQVGHEIGSGRAVAGGAGDIYAVLGIGATVPVVGVPVSYTHLRAHETVLDLVCRLLLEKKNKYMYENVICVTIISITTSQTIY